MDLKIKSNRKFLVKLFLVFDIIGTVLLIATLICYFVLKRTDPSIKEFLYVVILNSVSVALFTIGILVSKFYNGKSYIFKTDEIQVFNRGKAKYTIYIKDIQEAYYQPFKFKYFWEDEMKDGAWKIHVLLKDGSKKSLGFFDTNDIDEISKIYGDLIKTND